MPSAPIRSRVSGTGFHVPGPPVTNEEVIRRFGLDVSPEWIESRTGIRARHLLGPGLATSDLAVEAARAALADAGCGVADVDRVLVATVTPDLPTPATATIVARKLGLRGMAFDLSAACSGFVYGLELAHCAIVAGRARRVLVIAADTRSRFVDPADRRSVVLFGDGAAAAVVEASAGDAGFLGFHTGGEGLDELGAWIPAGGSARPTTVETVAAGEQYVRLSSRRVLFPIVVGYGVASGRAALADAGLGIDAIDHVVPHQGNGLLVDQLVAELGAPAARGVKTIGAFGSCSTAGLPLALAAARADGRIRDGQTVLLASVGAGWTSASAVLRF